MHAAPFDRLLDDLLALEGELRRVLRLHDVVDGSFSSMIYTSTCYDVTNEHPDDVANEAPKPNRRFGREMHSPLH